MGFEPGWTAASAQLAELAATVEPAPPEFRAKVRTCLFLAGAAEEAARFYVSLLPDSGIDAVVRPDPAGPPLVVEFTLAGTPCMTMNGNPDPVPSHLASISVLTEDQAETDRLWRALLDGGGVEGVCGWLRDRFGVHWQIVPKAVPRLMHGGDPAAAGRVSAALRAMKKIDIAGLEAAARGG
ncbi:MAG: VOC family protein [Hyphomicrobiales bacterium]|nr:VOC family protein [Hyphomicrobiales bacterium]MCP5372116.1 VOC family protein [Hyphomicrobiales bacterium]